MSGQGITSTVAKMMLLAKQKLLMDNFFLEFKEAAKQMVLPLNRKGPNGLELFHREKHFCMLAVVDRIKAEIQQNCGVSTSDPPFSKHIVAYKAYIEAWSSSNPERLEMFYANIAAKNIEVSSDWQLQNNYRGIITMPLDYANLSSSEEGKEEEGILLSDGSWSNARSQAGGGFSIFKGNSVKNPAVMRCGPLSYRGSNVVRGPTSHPLTTSYPLTGPSHPLTRKGYTSHPLDGRRTLVYELKALYEGLDYNHKFLKLPALTVLTDSSDLHRVLTRFHTVPETLGADVAESEEYYREFMLVFSLLRQMRVRVENIYREANMLADTLSYLGQQKRYNWQDTTVERDAEVLQCLKVYQRFDDGLRHQQ